MVYISHSGLPCVNSLSIVNLRLFQIVGVTYQVGELYGFFKTKKEYEKEHQAAREREYLEELEKANGNGNNHASS